MSRGDSTGALKIHLIQRLDDDVRDQQAREPFVIGRDDVPGRLLGARRGKGLAVGGRVFRPVLDARGHRAPRISSSWSRSSNRSRRRRCCSPRETWKKNLRIDRAVAPQVALQIADVLEPFLPDPRSDEIRRQLLLAEEFRMHAHHDHVLVVRAIEDADRCRAPAAPSPRARGNRDRPPRSVGCLNMWTSVIERVHARHDVLDRAVFA